MSSRDADSPQRPPAEAPKVAELRDYPYRGRHLPVLRYPKALLRWVRSMVRRTSDLEHWWRLIRNLRRTTRTDLRWALHCAADAVLWPWRPAARIRHVARGLRRDRDSVSVAMYVHYSPHGTVSEMVSEQLRTYAELGFNVIAITHSTQPGSAQWEKLHQHAALVVCRRNLGRDFGAWKDVMPLLLQHFPGTQEVLLANDSVLGPVRPMAPVLEALRAAGEGFLGLTESVQIATHLQSYFLLMRGAAAIADLTSFMRLMPMPWSKRRIVRRGEIALSGFMRKRGHRVMALFPYERVEMALVENEVDRTAFLATVRRRHLWLGHSGLEMRLHRWLLRRRLNPAHQFARLLVRHFDFPFIKAELVSRNPCLLPEALYWRQWLGPDAPCDADMLEAHLTDLARPPMRTAPILSLPYARPGIAHRPLVEDRSIAVPFQHAPSAVPIGRIGVLLHLHHEHLAKEMLAALVHLPASTDLHVTTNSPAKRDRIAQTLERWDKGSVSIRMVPNRGRDVAARLVGQRDIFEQYELLLCLHGKHHAGEPSSKHWRHHSLRHLLGSAAIAASAIDAFATRPELGILAPQHPEWLRPLICWGPNFAEAAALAERFGLDLRAADSLDFPAGSMFWARPSALQPLLSLGLTWDDFTPEAGQRDGTTAHAIERLPFLSCEAAGLRWAKVAVRRFHMNRSGITAVNSPEVLEEFLRNATQRLYPMAPRQMALTAAALAFPEAPGRPEVSVIVSSFGLVPLTLRCLGAIAAAPPSATLEVIVAEDASGDPAVDQLASVPGLQLIRNPTNLGFLNNCNSAAKTARGEYLLFLNNDTEPRPGAIDALLDLARARPDAGLIGSKLVFPSGHLQEAGGIIWRDASGCNVGRGDTNPDRPEYAYVREVDYCSGAAILIRRELFLDLDGFDRRLAPAYYEDADLAFRLRERGLKVLYQPAAVVMHHEGASHGTDLGRGVKAAQRRNQIIMRERWHTVLDAEHPEAGSSLVRAHDRAARRCITLVADHKVPQPDRDAGSRCCLDVLRCLIEAGHSVKFLPYDGSLGGVYGERLQNLGIEIAHGTESDRLAWIRRHGGDLDHALLMRPEVAEGLLPVIRQQSGARIVYFGHDLHAARLRAEALLKQDAKLLADAGKMELRERRLCREADVALFPSIDEVIEMRQLEPTADLRVLPLYRISRAEPRTSPPRGADLLFVAGFAHPPNEDGARWFVESVLPQVRASCPEVRLRVVGSESDRLATNLGGSEVDVTGPVSEAELAYHYRSARLVVAPLRFGGGVKGKVVEAMAKGLPLVTTPVGIQGLPGLGEIVPVTTSAGGMAEAVLALLQDDVAWTKQSRAQANYVLAEFDPQRMQNALYDAFVPASEQAPTA